MKYYYVTYEWKINPKEGYGDFVMSRENFSVKDFKNAASDYSGKPASAMHINVMEITESEFVMNKLEFESRK